MMISIFAAENLRARRKTRARSEKLFDPIASFSFFEDRMNTIDNF